MILIALLLIARNKVNEKIAGKIFYDARRFELVPQLKFISTQYECYFCADAVVDLQMCRPRGDLSNGGGCPPAFSVFSQNTDFFLREFPERLS